MPRRLNTPVAWSELGWVVADGGRAYHLRLVNRPNGHVLWNTSRREVVTHLLHAYVIHSDPGHEQGYARAYLRQGLSGRRLGGRSRSETFWWGSGDVDTQGAISQATAALVGWWRERYAWRADARFDWAFEQQEQYLWSGEYLSLNPSAGGAPAGMTLPVYTTVHEQIPHLSAGWWIERRELVRNAT